MLKRRMNMNQDQFLLKWNNHQNNFVEVFSFLRAQDAFVDVTLACDGKSFPAHKVVLSACSPYFQALFQNNPCKHPIVFLKDVKGQELEALIEFIYKGEVSVCQSELASLISTAENLKIKGLAEPDRPIDKGYKRISSPPRIQQSVSLPQAMPPCSLPPQGISPPQQTITHHKVVKYPQSSPGAKRKRLDTSGVYTSAIGNIYSSSSRDNEPDIDDNIESIALRNEQQHSVVASAPLGPGPGGPTAQVVLVSAHELPPHQAGEIIPVQSYASHHSAANSESGGGAVLYTVSSVSGSGIYAATAGQQVSSSSTRVEPTLMQRGEQPHYTQPDVYLSEDESHHESTISGSSVVKTAHSHSDHQSHAMAIKMEPSISHQMDQWEESDQGYEDKVPQGSVGSLPPEVSAESLENAARDPHSLQMPMHSEMSDASQPYDSSRLLAARAILRALGAAASSGGGQNSTWGPDGIKPISMPGQCRVCGENIPRGEHRSHMASHTAHRPLHCTVCGRGFHQTEDLKRHIRIHTGEKPYKCIMCGVAFRQRGHLSRHIFKYHPEHRTSRSIKHATPMSSQRQSTGTPSI